MRTVGLSPVPPYQAAGRELREDSQREGCGKDPALMHMFCSTLILITLPSTYIFSCRELRDDCGVDPARVKHLQRLEAKRGTISAFFAKQVISPCWVIPGSACLPCTPASKSTQGKCNQPQ